MLNTLIASLLWKPRRGRNRWPNVKEELTRKYLAGGSERPLQELNSKVVAVMAEMGEWRKLAMEVVAELMVSKADAALQSALQEWTSEKLGSQALGMRI